ncbi:MAG: hypothetical protein IJY39_14190 [Clostridia bacterium]|nr:hypothetical protein [Clostridia bacterium]
MKSKRLRYLSLLLCLLLLLPSCDVKQPDEGDSDSETIATERNTEEAIEDLPSETQAKTEEQSTEEQSAEEVTTEWIARSEGMEDTPPDLESIDYSKLRFYTDPVEAPEGGTLSFEGKSLKNVVELIETQEKEATVAKDHEEASALMNQILENTENSFVQIVLIINYTESPGIYADDTYPQLEYCCDLGMNGGNNQLVFCYVKPGVAFRTPEYLMKAFERYTRYSTVTSVVVSAAPISVE